MDKKKLAVAIVTVFLIMILVSGSTYAYWSWISGNTEKTNVTFTSTRDYSCSADGGGNITSANYKLAPTDCTDPSYAIQRTVTANLINTRGTNVYFDLWLDINSIGSGLSESENLKYAVTQQVNNCEDNVITQGTFEGITSGDTLAFLTTPAAKLFLSNTLSTYYLYIWLDEAETGVGTQNQNFDFSLNGRCADVLYGDINGDGSVNNRDVTTLIRYINYGDNSVSSFEAADLDVDGDIDLDDYQLLIDFTRNRGVSPILGPH